MAAEPMRALKAFRINARDADLNDPAGFGLKTVSVAYLFEREKSLIPSEREKHIP